MKIIGSKKNLPVGKILVNMSGEEIILQSGRKKIAPQGSLLETKLFSLMQFIKSHFKK